MSGIRVECEGAGAAGGGRPLLLDGSPQGPDESGVGAHDRPHVDLQDLECLTPDEVCGLLKVTKDWLYDAVQAGHVPAVRLHPRSRQLRFRAKDLAALLEANYVAPCAARPEPRVEEQPAPRLSPEVAARFGLAEVERPGEALGDESRQARLTVVFDDQASGAPSATGSRWPRAPQ